MRVDLFLNRMFDPALASGVHVNSTEQFHVIITAYAHTKTSIYALRGADLRLQALFLVAVFQE